MSDKRGRIIRASKDAQQDRGRRRLRCPTCETLVLVDIGPDGSWSCPECWSPGWAVDEESAA